MSTDINLIDHKNVAQVRSVRVDTVSEMSTSVNAWQLSIRIMVEAVSEMSTKVDKRHMVDMQEIETIKKMSTEVDV